MVKKISGPGDIKAPQDISSISEVSGVSEVSSVKAVSGVSGVGGVGAIEGLGTKLTSENKEMVLAAIEQEAQKIFAGQRIPRKRQKTITDALKMAVMAATAKEEDEEVDPNKVKSIIEKFSK
jgi:hypothetical protein